MNWRLLSQPRWVLGHLVVLAMVGVMLSASYWQWTRLQERKVANAEVLASLQAPAENLMSAFQIEALGEFQKVSARGFWDYQHEVYVRYPIFEGAQGFYVLTPFRLQDGSSVVVNRGWLPQDAGQDDTRPRLVADQAETDLTGYVRSEERASESTSATSGESPIPTVTAIDALTLAPLMEVDSLANKWVQLESPTRPDGPRLLPPPETNEGSHFSYTLQWLAFAVVTLVGYALLLRRIQKDSLNSH